MPRRVVLTAALLAVLWATAPAQSAPHPLPPLDPAPADGLSLALRTGRITEAQYALERAAVLFDADRVARRFGWVAEPASRDATLTLLDLALRLDGLPPAERERAERLLARPTDPGSFEAAHYDEASLPFLDTWCAEVCVTWAKTGRDAPPLTDAGGNGRPDYIDTVVEVLDRVWATEIVEMGYRPPKSDASSPDPDAHGPQLDVYVLDLLGKTSGIVGYCATDDPNVGNPGYPGLDASAYCIFDDDYAEYGSRAIDLLEVTAAHEFFHAVQFAYNAAQDRWLMEGTATWIEDEVFDDVNDNYNYLSTSQVVDPTIPLDLFAPFSGRAGQFVYGNYAFFQLITDTHGTSIVRETQEQGDGVPGKPGNHSLLALPAALAAHGLDFADVYNRFALANWWPPAFHAEGSGWMVDDGNGNAVQASVPPPRPSVLTARRPGTAWRTLRLDHLTSGYATFVPGRGVGRGSRLEITVDLAGAGPGARAALVTASRSGALRVISIDLRRSGKGSATVAGFGKLRYAALVLSNGSTRVQGCGSDQTFPVYACLGDPVDDARPFRFRARLG